MSLLSHVKAVSTLKFDGHTFGEYVNIGAVTCQHGKSPYVPPPRDSASNTRDISHVTNFDIS